MRPALARAPGVGRLEVSASDTREVEVVVDPARLAAAGLSVGDVATALGSTNVLAPVGRYAASGRQYLALATGQWRSLADIGATPISLKGGSVVRVGDLGDVVMGAPDRTSLITANGRDAAVINVSQQVGSNVLDVKAGVEQALADLAQTLPSGLRVTKVYDLAEFVADAIASVRDAVVIGGLLAVIILFLFLRDWRITAVAATTLPVTAVATFFFLRLWGESVNLMSMGGLAVAIGLVIDDAVVVVENIHRQLESGGAGRCRRRDARAGRAGGRLDADDRCRVRAAGAAVGRDRSVLPIAGADAVGRRAAVAGAVVDAGAGAGGTGDGEPHARRGEPSDASA